MTGKIHRLSGTNELDDLRFAAKTVANILSVRKLPSPPPWGRFPFKRVNEEVKAGNPTLKDLTIWYNYATELIRNK